VLRWLWLSGLVVVLDQIIKIWADRSLAGQGPLNLLPHLDLRLAYNTGAAFSFLAGAGGWQRWFFAVLAVAVTLVLVIWLKRLPPRERLTGMSLALVIGGAVGNLIDRVLYGYVIDFIDVYYDAGLHWPAFNLADSAISVGVAGLLLDALRSHRNNT
jgi:signal peptidase II